MKSKRPVVLTALDLMPVKIGGMEMYLHEVARQLDEAGWDIVIYFACKPNTLVREYFDQPNVRLYAGEQLFQSAPAAYTCFNAMLNQHKPQIIHLHFCWRPLFPWLAKIHGVKHFYYTDHTSGYQGDEQEPRHLCYRLLARLILAPITCKISVSDYVNRRNLLRRVIPPERLVRIYNGVDLARLGTQGVGASFRAKHRIPLRATVITQVSAMIPEKGWNDLIEAARVVLRMDPSTYMVFVGEGRWQSQYMRQAGALNYPGRIIFAGASPDPFSDGVFAAADVVCQISRWDEAFGLSIAEAMAHGKPVIATRVGGIPELIEDGISGFLVERRDIAAIGARILELAGDRELRERLGKAGRQRVLERFDLRERVIDLIRLYGIAVNCAGEGRTVANAVSRKSFGALTDESYWDGVHRQSATVAKPSPHPMLRKWLLHIGRCYATDHFWTHCLGRHLTSGALGVIEIGSAPGDFLKD